MPRHCSVAGCSSNYDPKDHISTFQIPKQEPLRGQWLRKIPTDLSHLKTPIVCVKHFRDSDVIRKDCVVYKGEYREFDRKIPKLREGAVPCIFPNLAPYLSSSCTVSRRLPDVEQEQLTVAIKESLAEKSKFDERNCVKSVNDIVLFLKEKENELKGRWFFVGDETILRVCCYEICDDNVKIVGSIIVSSDLSFKVYVNKILLVRKNFCKGVEKVVSLIVFEKLMEMLEKNANNPEREKKCDMAVALLESANDELPSQELQFLIEQLKLSLQPKNCRRYSNNTIVVAASVYLHSAAAYYALLKCGVLCIPSVRVLQRMIASYSLDNFDLVGSIKYLETKCKFLRDQEKYVNVLLDEIYIEAVFNFKGGSVYGGADGNDSSAAKTAQVFMVSSVFSSYKDVVCIVPVSNLKADHLKQMMMSVLVEIERINLKVISFISDNNAVNRRAFELMSSKQILESQISHPLDNSRLLFLMFDSVHILKCLRNNWINKKESVITFPNFENMNMLHRANYKHLEILHDLEKDSLIKYGHTLSNKVLYPSHLQKQNVKLALNVINEKNIAALKSISKIHPDLFPDVDDTCLFLDIFTKWWKIVNCKSPFESQRFNDKFREPVRRNDDSHVNFLRKLSHWLKVWRQSLPVSDGLSAQTFQSLITTCDALVRMVPYLFQCCGADYLLLGKFQTDALEARFGAYRQMSGANYYISFVQVIESERRLRFQSNLLLSSKNENIPLKSLVPYHESVSHKYVNINSFSDLLLEYFSLENVPNEKLPIITYIAGYAAKKELKEKHCDICISWLQLKKSVKVQYSNSRDMSDEESDIYDYIRALDRGRLTLPTEIVNVAVALVWYVMNEIVSRRETIFLSCGHQLSVLYKLACVQLSRTGKCTKEECDCKVTLQTRLESICLLVSKVMLNNFVKYKNDFLTSNKQCKRKVKKFCA